MALISTSDINVVYRYNGWHLVEYDRLHKQLRYSVQKYNNTADTHYAWDARISITWRSWEPLMTDNIDDPALEAASIACACTVMMDKLHKSYGIITPTDLKLALEATKRLALIVEQVARKLEDMERITA